MESNNTYKPSSEVLSRYFAGECNPDELTHIQNWATENPENQEELALLQTIWQDVGAVRTEPIQVDTANAFAKVKAQKDAHEKTTPSFWNVWKVAAAILLMASAFLYLIQEDNDVQLVTYSITEVSLSDSTRVTVNEGSTLVYHKTFNTDTRKVTLSGEAFFEVTRNEQKPFIVEVGEITVTVLGTSFNIKESAKDIQVSVKTGRVEVKSAFGTKVLSAGEQVSVNLNSKELTKSNNSESGTEQYWFSKKLAFQGVAMRTVIADLEKTYGATIEVSNDQILQCKLQATFEGQSIEEVLDIISISQELSVELVKGTYLLTGEGCAN